MGTRSFTVPDLFDDKGRVPARATVKAYRTDTHAFVEEAIIDSNGNATFSALPTDTDIVFHATWGGISGTQKEKWFFSHVPGVAEGGTGASTAAGACSNLGVGTEDSPQFTAIELGNTSDTTVARAAAGRASVEGKGIVRGPASSTDNKVARYNGTTGDLVQESSSVLIDDDDNVSGVAKLTTTSDIELGHASDTTLHRESAGKVSVEGIVLTRATNYVVAANGAPAHVKAQADYVCDGTDDHIQFQAAIDALPATGGKVLFSEGTYNIESSITLDSYQTLAGMGKSSILTTTTADLDIITATGSSGSEKVGILLADFCVDGNAGSATNDIGIYWNYVDDSKILNCWVIDNGEDGIKIYNSDSNIINECLIADNNFEGIYVGTSNGNSIVGNVCRGNDWGMGVSSGEENAITSNVCHSNNVGIYLENSAHNSVSANTCMGNAEYGIQLTSSCDEGTVANNISEKNGYDGINVSSSDNVLIVNNTVTTNSQDATNTYDDIRLSGCSYCDVQGNLCRAGGETNKPAYAIDIELGCTGVKVINNDLYDDGFGTAAYYDGGTGTIYLPATGVGIADDQIVQIDDADAADNDYAKFTANGLEGRSASEVKTDLSLNNVENTAHSTDAHTMTIDGVDVSAHDVATTGVHGVSTDYVAISKSATLPALNVPLGTSWENRTYAGYEIVSTATTYTIGSGQDFETLAACAASLQGLILIAGITVQLQEAIELTASVTFTGMISAGGWLMLDLNGYDITVNLNGQAIIFDGQYTALVRDNSSAPYNSVIAKTDGNCSTLTYLVRWMNYANGNLYHVNLDANSETINAHLLVTNDARCLIYNGNADFLDTGAGGNYLRAVHIRYGGLVSAGGDMGVGSDEVTLDTGGMAIDSAGHIWTGAGEWNTPDA